MYGILVVMLLAVTLEVTSNANPGNQSHDLEIGNLLKKVEMFEEMLNSSLTTKDLEIEKLLNKVEVYEKIINASLTCNCNFNGHKIPEGNETDNGQDAVDSEVNQEMVKSLVHDTLSQLHITEKLPTQVNQMREEIDQAVDKIDEHEQALSSLQENQESDGVAFSVYLTVGYYTGVNEPVPFTGVHTNRGGHFSTTTHKFTCPVHGVYVFIYSLYSYDLYEGLCSSAALYVDGSRHTEVYSGENDPDHWSRHQSATGIILECRARQQVWLANHWTNNQIYGDGGDGDTVFSGYLLHTV